MEVDARVALVACLDQSENFAEKVLVKVRNSFLPRGGWGG